MFVSHLLWAPVVALGFLIVPAAPDRGRASGAVTIDGRQTPLTHAVRTTRPNAFDETVLDTVVVLSDRPLSAAEAADEAALLGRAQRGELVAVAVRFDDRKGRGRLFNVTLAHRGLEELARLPDVWFQYTFKGGIGTLQMERREFSGHTYAASVDFAVAAEVETTEATPPRALSLPPPSKTAAERAAATALLIEALQEGDEARALEIVKLGIDPNGRDDKMRIPVVNWAIINCQPPVVKALVELKADLAHERLPGMTLLSEATAACPDAVPFLRAGGAK